MSATVKVIKNEVKQLKQSGNFFNQKMNTGNYMKMEIDFDIDIDI